MLSEYERRVIAELEEQFSSDPAPSAVGFERTAVSDRGSARRPLAVLVPLTGALLVVTGMLVSGVAVTIGMLLLLGWGLVVLWRFLGEVGQWTDDPEFKSWRRSTSRPQFWWTWWAGGYRQ